MIGWWKNLSAEDQFGVALSAFSAGVILFIVMLFVVTIMENQCFPT